MKRRTVLVDDVTCLQCRCTDAFHIAVARTTITPADRVTALLSELNDDECAVILEITKRMVAGRTAYGALDLATDRRDWTREAEEEAWDLAAYVAMRACVRSRGR